jgi:hypothetical protein
MTVQHGTAMVVRTREAWINQAKTAQDAWEKSGAPNLRTFAKVNYEQFCKLIEALHALGQKVDAEMMNLAKMRPVDEALELR